MSAVTFAQSARKLAGLACRSLGWRPCDFWDTTPAEIAAIFMSQGEAEDTPFSRAELVTLMELDRDG